MTPHPRSILVVGPHPDDQELGMGATIARLASQQHRITLLDMTSGEPTPFGNPATRAREAALAAQLLSPPDNPIRRIQLNLPNRAVQHSLEARHAVAAVIRAVQADILFVPFFEDAHPDHVAVTRIAEDARFDAKLSPPLPPLTDIAPAEIRDAPLGPPIYPKWLFYYYATHLRWAGAPSFLIDTTGFQPHKRNAILAYKSQFIDNPKNRDIPDRLDAAAVHFGSRIGTATAEPFFTKEPLGLTALAALA